MTSSKSELMETLRRVYSDGQNLFEDMGNWQLSYLIRREGATDEEHAEDVKRAAAISREEFIQCKKDKGRWPGYPWGFS